MIRPTTLARTGVAEEILTAAQRGELSLPPLPAIVTRVLGMVRDEERADLGEISDLMLDDTAITTAVLRIANSAAYAGSAATNELAPAIQRLGLRQVGMLVTSIAHKGNFRSSNPALLGVLQRLWDHALVSALAARELAGSNPVERIDAYVGGLLHDTGKLVVLKGIDRIDARLQGKGFTTEDIVELMEALHTVLGFSALRSWKVADRICQVALHHHDPNVTDQLQRLVQAADVIAHQLCSAREQVSAAELSRLAPMRALDLGDLEIARVLVQVEAEMAQAKSQLE